MQRPNVEYRHSKRYTTELSKSEAKPARNQKESQSTGVAAKQDVPSRAVQRRQDEA